MHSKQTDTKVSLLGNNPKIGVVYTPLKWAKWAIEISGAFKCWKNGGRVVDPNMGEGVFIEAFISLANEKSVTITEERIQSLYGFDIRDEGIKAFLKRIEGLYGIKLPHENYRNLDIINSELCEQFDFIVGNPPWVNFQNLPATYKEALKSKFLEYGLISNSGSALLGNSRVDLSALIINLLMHNLLGDTGKLAMFVPSSLFFGGSAHNEFRKYVAKGKHFYLERLHDFGSIPIFSDESSHGTPYSFAEFNLTFSKNDFPYYKMNSNGFWEKSNISVSAGKHNGYLRSKSFEKTRMLTIPKISMPRQGLNTGGRNSLFFGDLVEGSLSDNIVLFKNLNNLIFPIETELLYPLLQRENIKGESMALKRLVILPHNKHNGKVLESEELAQYPNALKYIGSLQAELENRKGLLLNVNIRKGLYWGLMGVGEYNFHPYKIVWLTSGESRLQPMLVDNLHGKQWQANQSLQAYMPFREKAEAQIKLEELLELAANLDPEALGTPGTLGWAQPGRMKNILNLI